MVGSLPWESCKSEIPLCGAAGCLPAQLVWSCANDGAFQLLAQQVAQETLLPLKIGWWHIWQQSGGQWGVPHGAEAMLCRAAHCRDKMTSKWVPECNSQEWCSISSCWCVLLTKWKAKWMLVRLAQFLFHPAAWLCCRIADWQTQVLFMIQLCFFASQLLTSRWLMLQAFSSKRRERDWQQGVESTRWWSVSSFLLPAVMGETIFWSEWSDLFSCMPFSSCPWSCWQCTCAGKRPSSWFHFLCSHWLLALERATLAL